MGKRCICNVVIHVPEELNVNHLTERVSDFYIEIAERRLKNSGLPQEKQIAVIDRIMEKRKENEGVF